MSSIFIILDKNESCCIIRLILNAMIFNAKCHWTYIDDPCPATRAVLADVLPGVSECVHRGQHLVILLGVEGFHVAHLPRVRRGGVIASHRHLGTKKWGMCLVMHLVNYHVKKKIGPKEKLHGTTHIFHAYAIKEECNAAMRILMIISRLMCY